MKKRNTSKLANKLSLLVWTPVLALMSFNVGKALKNSLEDAQATQAQTRQITSEDKPLYLEKLAIKPIEQEPNLTPTTAPIPVKRPADRYDVSQEGIELIKQHEGFRPNAYQCQAGVWTIGYGTTQCVKKGDTITREQAEQRLNQYLNTAIEPSIERQVSIPLYQSEFDALASWMYNIGTGASAKSTLIDELNKGNRNSATAELSKWDKVTRNGKKTISKGLVKRRAAEQKLFQQRH